MSLVHPGKLFRNCLTNYRFSGWFLIVYKKKVYFEEHLQTAASENMFMKLRNIKVSHQVSSTSISETSLWMVFHHLFSMKFIFTYKSSLNKRRSKVQEKNMPCEQALNFDQWKTFSENYKPIKVWLWPVCKIYRELLLLETFLRVYSNSKKGILPLLIKYAS